MGQERSFWPLVGRSAHCRGGVHVRGRCSSFGAATDVPACFFVLPLCSGRSRQAWPQQAGRISAQTGSSPAAYRSQPRTPACVLESSCCFNFSLGQGVKH